MSKWIPKTLTVVGLLGIMLIAIPIAIFVNVVLILDSYITQLYRRKKLFKKGLFGKKT